MTQEERDRSEAQRKSIAEMSRAANPPHARKTRVVPAADRDQELMARLGFTVPPGQGPVDWRALTASA